MACVYVAANQGSGRLLTGRRVKAGQAVDQ